MHKSTLAQDNNSTSVKKAILWEDIKSMLATYKQALFGNLPSAKCKQYYLENVTQHSFHKARGECYSDNHGADQLL